MDRVLALHAGSRGFDSHRGHMSERFLRSNRPGYPHPVSSELENSGIRVAVGDCSVTERRRWRPPYQTGKTVHVHAKHNKDGQTAPGVCGNGSVPLSHSGNVVTRIGIHTHTRLYRIFPAIRRGFRPSRMTSNNLISPMKFCYNTNSTLPKQCQSSRSILQDGSRTYGLFWKEKTPSYNRRNTVNANQLCN